MIFWIGSGQPSGGLNRRPAGTILATYKRKRTGPRCSVSNNFRRSLWAKKFFVWDGEFHPCPKPISSATRWDIWQQLINKVSWWNPLVRGLVLDPLAVYSSRTVYVYLYQLKGLSLRLFYEIRTNGWHFVKNHLKSGQKCPDFEWSGSPMLKHNHLKSDQSLDFKWLDFRYPLYVFFRIMFVRDFRYLIIYRILLHTWIQISNKMTNIVPPCSLKRKCKTQWQFRK